MKHNFKQMSYLFFFLYIFFGLAPSSYAQQSKTIRQVQNNQPNKSVTTRQSNIKKNTENLPNELTDVDQLSTSLEALTVGEVPAETVVLPDGKTRAKKDWNFIVYMVNNNNLHKYGVKNFKQMAKIGSTKYINLLIQMDDLGTSDIKRYYIEKNNPVAIDSDTFVGSTMSGTPDNFFEFVKWSIKNYPAKKQAIVIWNHGSGIKDPSMWGRVIMKCRDDFFSLNKQTGLLELNRSAMDRIFNQLNKERGIGFNDETEQYITNQDLKNTLEKISKELLKGAKIDLVCMDACHMGMVEIGSQIATSVEFMTGSEEVEPGSGYNYEKTLAPFTQGTLSTQEFARHVVSVYEAEYKNALADYTQSAINLEKITDVEDNINNVSIVMISLLKTLPSFVKTIKEIRRSKKQTTVFFDTDYIDLHHFYTSLLKKSQALKISTKEKETAETTTKAQASELLEELTGLLEEGIATLESTIIENVCGSSLPNARGLSIYFPQKTPHASYQKTVFAKITKWPNFVKEYQKLA